MSYYLGIDTSNYTTSAAIFDDEKGTIKQEKMLLPVKPGERGLRQSDALFHHTKQLPIIIEKVFSGFSGNIKSVGVSEKPRNNPESYMPCFLAGVSVAKSISSALNVPFCTFSHQAGHIAAALYSANRLDLFHKEFLAFHLSGGTTELLLVKPNTETVFDIEIIAKTLDINAGQVVDRTGVFLGLPFPCGMYLEKLSQSSYTEDFKKLSLNFGNCSLSGLENVIKALKVNGKSDDYIARYTFNSLYYVIKNMVEFALKSYGDLPIIFAGGVMSNSIIKSKLKSDFCNSYFAEPQFSSDNAAGIAVLTKLKKE